MRLVTQGWLARLGPSAGLTYLFLCTVADPSGISFWGRERIAERLLLTLTDVDSAFRVLADSDLIATRGRVVQVLALPRSTSSDGEPQSAAPSRAQHVAQPRPAAVAPEVLDLDEEEIRGFEPQARCRLADALGARHESPPSVVRALAVTLATQARRSAQAANPAGGAHRG
jgi:hypothetical protein